MVDQRETRALRGTSPARAAAAATLAAGLALAGAGCSPDEQTIAAGTVVAAPGVVDGDDASVTVRVPTGAVRLGVADPAGAVGSDRAADGASLLALEVAFDRSAVRSDVADLARVPGAGSPVELAVEVAGERYDVGTVGDPDGAVADDGSDERLGGDVLVAVEGAPDLDDVTVVVGYDGLDQRVALVDGAREPGPADPLYVAEREPRGPVTCDVDPAPRGVEVEGLACRAERMVSVPYVPGAGWAAEGNTWAVVPLVVSVTGVATTAPATADRGAYTVTGADQTVALGGAPPVTELDVTETGDGASYTSRLVFSLGADTPLDLELRRTYALRADSGAVPARRELVLDAALRLPATLRPPG